MRRIGISLLVLLLPAAQAPAGQYYIGGGASQVWIKSDHPAIGSQSATGFHGTAGVIWNKLGLDITITGTTLDTGEVTDIYYPPDSAAYGIIDFGLKYYLFPHDDEDIIPWIGAGLGVHLISWDTYWYNVDGGGYSLSAGFDSKLISRLYLRAGVKYHHFTSEDTYDYGPYDGNATEVDVGLIWLFGDNHGY